MIPETETLGAFPGAQRSAAACEYVMISRIPRERLEPERVLFQHKWFDYRFMHPTMATSYYAQCYKDVYRRLFARHIDRDVSRYVAGIKLGDIFAKTDDEKLLKSQSGTISACWRGRQTADALGIPYPLFIELAMTKALSWQRKYMPRPQQLYSDQIIEAVEGGWQERTRGRFIIAQDPRYRLNAWAGTPAQIAHESWVCTQIIRRSPGTQLHLLEQHLTVDPLIREEAARARFDGALVNEALGLR
ncbi:hypothetical protein F1188_19635 [Roseospira marina]|uniref:Uncharacterized protein n=1 Tax=Roseospira marina TaxID=140057 RepID=A0A5M6I6P7_9PROT|nr:hypothetical protein [Roseospira marina]KAA5603488.1 hypothetical protein F1188_19635 [Roseospira marina]MBB4315484.1 hypothetical protein [Roseospira marina]MBB5088370.1 hypothetical protein [Roseospira marina]